MIETSFPESLSIETRVNPQVIHGAAIWLAEVRSFVLVSHLLQIIASGAMIKSMVELLQAGRVQSGESAKVTAALIAMQPTLSPEEYSRRATKLRIALENAGQQILLQYLKGESVPQKPEMFQLGAEFFAAELRGLEAALKKVGKRAAALMDQTS